VVFEGGFGVRELAKPTPVDADTLFMIGVQHQGMSTLLLAKRSTRASLAGTSR